MINKIKSLFASPTGQIIIKDIKSAVWRSVIGLVIALLAIFTKYIPDLPASAIVITIISTIVAEITKDLNQYYQGLSNKVN
jgi:ABC-type Mn2+/Zn2+ transport system permease subunit